MPVFIACAVLAIAGVVFGLFPSAWAYVERLPNWFWLLVGSAVLLWGFSLGPP